MTNLNQLRQQINDIDNQLDILLNRRFYISKDIAQYKNKHHQPIYDSFREYQLLNSLKQQDKLNFLKGHIYLKQQLMFTSRQYQYQFINLHSYQPDNISNLRYGCYQHQEHVSAILYSSYELLMHALNYEDIDIAIISFKINNVDNIRKLENEDLYIIKYTNENIAYLSKKLMLPSVSQQIGIIVTMINKYTLSTIINLFHFHQINIQQLFFISSTQLFIYFDGNIKNTTIQSVLSILKQEQQQIKIKIIN